MQDDGGGGRPFGTGPRPQQRIRVDLERRGVDEQMSESFASRLAEIASDLSASEYHAALLAMAAAYEVVQSEADELERRCRDVRQIQQLMQAFADELRKVEEGLSIVSAFLVRMRMTADGGDEGSIH
jgi:hypothetical protein